jgi:hypothetical protein
MTVVPADIQDNETVEWLPASTATSLSDWIGDKGKYFCEAVSNISFYMSQIPTFYGHGVSQTWDQVGSGMKSCKKILAFPSVFKNGVTFYDHIKEGKERTRNLLGEVSYIIGDTIDTVQGYMALATKAIPPGIRGPLERIKECCGIFGLTNTSYNLTVDINKLRQIDVTQKPHPGVQDQKTAVELKRHIIDSEIDSKWYDRLRCISSIGMCVLGLTGAVCGTAFSPWLFAGIVSVSLYGKHRMYASKAEGMFYQTRYAELIPPAHINPEAKFVEV